MLSGPMFEPSETEVWKSSYNKSGAHYNIFGTKDDDLSMKGLRQLFPDGEANEYNLCLFSTSGIHGSYGTIEEAEKDDNPSVTFLVIQPRIVCMRYGNVQPQSKDDFDFLKKLRASSWKELKKIGKAQ